MGTTNASVNTASQLSNTTAFRTISTDGLTLLKAVESLSLTPYDDQTGKTATQWVSGATVGYGHLINKVEWSKYKDGISEKEADSLFRADLAPFISTVRTTITADITQPQFDALVVLAYNIGRAAFVSSSVAKLVNDPTAVTGHISLESAWKTWSRSQGKEMKGLTNRRACEWAIYDKGIYKAW